jgi:hypothetical protein
VDFYLYAAALGVAISIAWVGWLFTARAILRKYRLKPGYLLTILQVALVLGLILAGFRISDRCLQAIGLSTPANTILFRRIWIAVWALAMLASIQVFLDIRRMAAADTESTRGCTPRPQSRRKSSPSRRPR